MLFNSPEFIFIFLPMAAFIFFILSRLYSRLGLAWLSVASLLFYAYWNPKYLPLICSSIMFNYFLGKTIFKLKNTAHIILSKYILFFSILCNLLLLIYYKYADFFITFNNTIMHSHYSLLEIILPLGISFFTFTQIAYLVDCFKYDHIEFGFIKYVLFVSYFPHLISGPILHHKEMISQFNKNDIYQPNGQYIAAGLTLFSLGLFKKLFFADNIAKIANLTFEAAHSGTLPLFDAWSGSLAYTLQIYYDFSGYSDMAIGLSFLFGIRLPVNFNSPYKSTSIIEFWRRWHMTLSRFLRDYLYIPLGGNQKGPNRRYINLMITMLLGGLWHGAGWTFIIWGGLHGLYLSINHGWRYFCQKIRLTLTGRLYQIIVTLITFLSVIFSWVFFRASDTKTALNIIRSMLGTQTTSNHSQTLSYYNIFLLSILLVIAWFLPNSLQIMNKINMALNISIDSKSTSWYQWRVTPLWGCFMGLLFAIATLGVLAIGDGAEFLYFRF